MPQKSPAEPIDRVSLKNCRCCKKDNIADNFFRDRSRKDGLSAYCKPCHSAKLKVIYERDKEKILARQKEYTASHKEQKYLTDKAYRQRTADKQRAYQKEYKRRKKAELNEAQRRRYKEKPQFRIAALLRNRLNFVLNGKRRAQSMRDLLGCSPEEVKQHIESQFADGMTWDNHGQWHIDHIKPLKGAGVNLENPEQLAELCHYTNLQPLWSRDNIVKSNRMAS